jgi:hypothetical protein
MALTGGIYQATAEHKLALRVFFTQAKNLGNTSPGFFPLTRDRLTLRNGKYELPWKQR